MYADLATRSFSSIYLQKIWVALTSTLKKKRHHPWELAQEQRCVSSGSPAAALEARVSVAVAVYRHDLGRGHARVRVHDLDLFRTLGRVAGISNGRDRGWRVLCHGLALDHGHDHETGLVLSGPGRDL